MWPLLADEKHFCWLPVGSGRGRSGNTLPGLTTAPEKKAPVRCEPARASAMRAAPPPERPRRLLTRRMYSHLGFQKTMPLQGAATAAPDPEVASVDQGTHWRPSRMLRTRTTVQYAGLDEGGPSATVDGLSDEEEANTAIPKKRGRPKDSGKGKASTPTGGGGGLFGSDSDDEEGSLFGSSAPKPPSGGGGGLFD